MKLHCSGSDSDGNGYVLECSKGKILLDAGCNWRDVQKSCNYNVHDILFALITHKHGDHSKYAYQIASKGIPVYSDLANNNRHIISGVGVIPFDVPHTNNDGTDCPCKAYLIEADGERLLYMTDWMYCRYRLTKFNINHFLIAINYTDLEDDGQGGIHHVMQGHSSLDTVLEFLRVNVTDSCRSVIACHVSERNGDELKIMEGLVNTVPRVRTIGIAKKGITYEL